MKYSGKVSRKKCFRVYGAGFSGLATAACLHWQGAKVEVYEPNSGGGIVQTVPSVFDGVYESAAMGVVRTELTQKLFDFARVEEAATSALVAKKYIFSDQPSRLPVTLADVPRAVLGALRISLKAASARPRRAERLRDWGERVLGQGGCRKLLEPGFQGVYGGGSADLSATLVTAKLFGARRFKAIKLRGGITCYPQGGMATLMSGLRRRLEKEGVTFFNSVGPSDLASLEDQSVVCVGLSSFLKMNCSGTSYENFSQKLRQVPKLDLASAYVVSKRPPSRFEGYGCLFPEASGFSALGVQLDAGVFREPLDDVHFHRFIYGWQKGFDLRECINENVPKVAEADYRRLYKEPGEILDQQVSVWRSAIPHYGLPLEEALLSLPPASRGLAVFGNFTGTIGLSDILEKSYLWAKEVA
jgi:oxygen-dependent protoporphyrinogen oxidase